MCTQWLLNLHYHDTSIHIIRSLDLCNAIRQNELCKLKERITNPRERVAQFETPQQNPCSSKGFRSKVEGLTPIDKHTKVNKYS